MYTVKQVASLAGVHEATLRAWERRYGIVVPQRSPGGYRLYDENQVAVLRDMAALVTQGVPASQAAHTVREKHSAAKTSEPLSKLSEDDLVVAAASLEPAHLDHVIEKAFASGPFEQVVDGWLQPQLKLLGTAWRSGQLTIAQEHFVSAGLMRTLATAYDEAGNYDEAGKSGGGPVVIVGLPAGERHELPLLAFATCLRRLGVNVVYLGADVPTAEWVQGAARLCARAAVIGVTSPQSAAKARSVVEKLAHVNPPASVWVGGSHREKVVGAHSLPDRVSEAATLLELELAAGGT